MAHRYIGSRVAVAMCGLAAGLVFVGIAGKNAMTACDVIETRDATTGEVQTTFVFDRDACRDTERKRNLRNRTWSWGLAGAASLLVAAGAFSTSRVGADPRD